MTNLTQLSLMDLLPSSVKNNKELEVIATALDKELQAITAEIEEIILLPRIDQLSEKTIDSLAWQFHVDFYEPLGLSLDKKKALVKNALSWHRRKGTKSVLEEIIQILFFNDFEISEWFEYEGEPYFFRIIIHELVDDRQKFQELIRAIYELKNTRSWLDYVKRTRKTETTVFFSMTTKHIRRTELALEAIVFQSIQSIMSIGTAVKQVRRYKIHPSFNIAPLHLNIYSGFASKHIRRRKIFD